MGEELNNTTEVAKNALEFVNNFYSNIRPIVQPVAKCIGAVLDLARINYKFRLEQYQKKMEGEPAPQLP